MADKAVREDLTSIRFPIRFTDQDLKERAACIASHIGMPLTYVIRAIAGEMELADSDFSVPATHGEGRTDSKESVRMLVTLPADLVKDYTNRHDPLKVYAPSVLLRPVVQAAFERTASIWISEFESRPDFQGDIKGQTK